MSRLAVCFLTLSFACVGCGGGGLQPSTEQPTTGVFGTWKVTSLEGRIANVSKDATITLVRDLGEDSGADKVIVRKLKPGDSGPIDLQFFSEPDAWRGVYDLKGDELRIALNRPGLAPPEAPRGKPADAALTLKRP